MQNKTIELRLKKEAIGNRNAWMLNVIAAEQKIQTESMQQIHKEVAEFIETIKEIPSSPKSPAKA